MERKFRPKMYSLMYPDFFYSPGMAVRILEFRLGDSEQGQTRALEE